MAFEVQLAPISPPALRRRRARYASIGVRNYWLMGETDLHRSRHALAGLLARADGQRLVYVGGPGAEATEKICWDPAVRPGASAMAPPYLTVVYGLDRLRLATDGRLSTPADAEWERRMAALERARAAALLPRPSTPGNGTRWPRTGVSHDVLGKERGGAHAPQPIPADLSERAIEEAPAWAIKMHQHRTRLARRMADEDAGTKPEG